MTRSLLLLLPLLLACGKGESGLPLDKTLAELDESEWEQLCEWGNAQYEEAEVDCGDGVTVSVGTVDECVEESLAYYGECSSTVESMEACVGAIAEDPCSSELPAECTGILACAFANFEG
jgi:hypothetical protein